MSLISHRDNNHRLRDEIGDLSFKKNTKFPFKAKKKERYLCVLYLLAVIYLTSLYIVTITTMLFVFLSHGRTLMRVIHDVLYMTSPFVLLFSFCFLVFVKTKQDTVVSV